MCSHPEHRHEYGSDAAWESDDLESGAELPAVAFAQWIGNSAERALVVHVDSGAASLVAARLEGAGAG